MSITFTVERFEGPLDLLLQLVEKNELDISTISLAAVADQFMKYVQSHPAIPLEEVADFLVVAAKLIYRKSKLLLPSLVDEELEEGPSLEEQLRRYRTFVDASQKINRQWNSGARSFERLHRMARLRNVTFIPPEEVTSSFLALVMRRIIARFEPITKLPKAAVLRIVTIQEKIRHLLLRIRDIVSTSFSAVLGKRASKQDVIVSFLALLELAKQGFVLVTQHDIFTDIAIEKHPEAPAHDPLAHSFVYEI